MEGIGFSAIIFMAVEIIAEGLFQKTSEIVEFLKMSPDAPKSKALYYDLQVNKGVIGVLLSWIALVTARFKYKLEVNFWHFIGAFIGLIGYGVYISIKYSQYFAGTVY